MFSFVELLPSSPILSWQSHFLYWWLSITEQRHAEFNNFYHKVILKPDSISGHKAVFAPSVSHGFIQAILLLLLQEGSHHTAPGFNEWAWLLSPTSQWAIHLTSTNHQVWYPEAGTGKSSSSSSTVQFSCSVVSNYLQPHGPQHTRPPCPSPAPRVDPNSCPSGWWCYPTNSSSVIPISSCPQSFPASGGQSIGVSASASVLPMNTQDWSNLGWASWISLQSKVLSRVFSNTTVQKHQSFRAQLSLYLQLYWPPNLSILYLFHKDAYFASFYCFQ